MCGRLCKPNRLDTRGALAHWRPPVGPLGAQLQRFPSTMVTMVRHGAEGKAEVVGTHRAGLISFWPFFVARNRQKATRSCRWKTSGTASCRPFVIRDLAEAVSSESWR